MKYSLRVWKILDNNANQLIDIVESDNKAYINKMLKLLNELYCYYNYKVELKRY